MKIICGLGNPGISYSVTRHNCGFLTLDAIAKELNNEISRKEQNALTAIIHNSGEKILLVKPQSYMNLSGFPLSALVNYYKVEIEDVLVIFDDMSLPVGTIRFRRGGTSGGHNGMQSIIEQLGTVNINRLKIGIGTPVYPDAKDYVLGRFSEEEIPVMAKVFATAKDAALFWVRNGINNAMNEYNKKDLNDDEKSNQAEKE